MCIKTYLVSLSDKMVQFFNVLVLYLLNRLTKLMHFHASYVHETSVFFHLSFDGGLHVINVRHGALF